MKNFSIRALALLSLMCVVNAQMVREGNSGQTLHLLPANTKEEKVQSDVFEFLATGPHQLEVHFKDGAKTLPLKAELTCLDVFSKVLKSYPLELKATSDSPSGAVQGTFEVPKLAAYGTIAFHPVSGVTLESVSLHAIPPGIAPWKEGWRANWIVAPEAKTLPDAPRYYRREFTIPSVSAVISAQIQATGDDYLRIYINGRALPKGKKWRNWRLPDVYDLKPYLLDGKNVVGIEAGNKDSWEGVLAELTLQLRDSERTIHSDKEWRTFVGEAEKDWSKRSFKADPWKPAVELGTPPVEPWGEVSYTFLGRKSPVEVLTFSAPESAEPGQKIDVQFDFVPQGNPGHSVALQLWLTPTDAASALPDFDFPSIPVDVGHWKAGEPVRSRHSVRLPKYLPGGDYSLRATLTYASIIPEGREVMQSIKLKALAVPSSPVAKVVYLPGNIPALEVNGKTVSAMNFLTNAVENGGSISRAVQQESLKNSRESHIGLIFMNAGGFDWEPDAPATFKAMDEAVLAVLEADPEAYLVLNVWVDPSRNEGMKKWLDLHPDELILNDEGKTALTRYNGAPSRGEKYASFASEVWMKDTTKSWRELIQHVRSAPYADRVIGYFPLAGISSEWLHYGSHGKDFVDYSQPFRRAFAAWVKAQYRGDLALLNQTWKTKYASFDAIELPTKEERMAAGNGTFLNPQQDAGSIDLREFFTQVISGDILDFCRVVKEETQGNAICGTYYGYVMNVGRAYYGPHSGHFGLGRVLASPDIDFLVSPSIYADRGLGGGSGFMTTVDSIKRHKKLYIDQADIRTYHSTDRIGKVNTLRDSVSVLQREFANTVVNGVSVQWYDFGKGRIAGDARLMQAVGKMQQIERTLQRQPRETTDSENAIAVITSEKSILYTKVDSMIHDAAIKRSIAQLNRMGTAWDAYLLSDLPKLGNYRCYLFLNCFNITDEQKKYIDENLKKDGKVLVWVNAAGIIEKNGKSAFGQAAYRPGRVSEVTGFTLKQLPEGPLVTQMTAGDHPLQRGISEGAVFGNQRVSGARFGVQDGLALGRFRNDGPTSLAVKPFEHWTSVYSAVPTLPAALLRNIAHLAGVPVINETDDDITYASKNLFAVHSLEGGHRTFTVGDKCTTAKELFSFQSYPVQDGKVSMEIPKGGTVLVLLEP